MSGAIRPHRLSGAQFDALAAGGGGADALDTLRRAQLSKRLLLLRELRGTGLTDATSQSAWAVLDAGATHAPEAARDVLSRPFVDTWASRQLRAGRQPTSDRPAGQQPTAAGADAGHYLIGLAAVTAVLAGVPFELPVPAGTGSLLLPGLGLIEAVDRLGSSATPLSFDGADLRLGSARLPLDGADCPLGVPAGNGHRAVRWSPYRKVARSREGGPVEIDDLDPYRTCFGLPATGRLDGTRASDLIRLLAQARSFIDAHLPGHGPTVRACLRCLVPVDAPAAGSVSASHQRAFGAVASSVPDNAPGLALLIVHETAHAKLGALLDLVELVEPACTGVYHAPWRADPRPATALLQGAYAHAAVADFWRVRRRHLAGVPGTAAQFEFDFWRRAARRAAGTLLDSPALTDLGRRFVTGLAQTLDDWSGEAVDTPVTAAVAACATVADIGWRLRNHRIGDAEVAALATAYRSGADCPMLPPARVEPDRTGRSALSGGLALAIRTHVVDQAVGPDGDTPWLAARAAGAPALPVGALVELVRADPADADTWGIFALALAESGRGEAARALTARPELVRHLLGVADDTDAILRIAAWLAASLPDGSPAR